MVRTFGGDFGGFLGIFFYFPMLQKSSTWVFWHFDDIKSAGLSSRLIRTGKYPFRPCYKKCSTFAFG